MSSIRILLADSQYLIREGLRRILSAQEGFEIVGEADGRDGLVDSIRRSRPDVVVLDHNSIEFYSGDRLEELEDLVDKSKLLIISQEQDKGRIQTILEWGVRSFLTKYCDQEEIVSAIYSAVKGEKYLCTKVVDMLIEANREEIEDDCIPSVLTEREEEIVRLIATGLKTRDIAEQLHLSPHTVNTHRKNILKKVGVKSGSELVLYAVSTGIVKAEGAS